MKIQNNISTGIKRKLYFVMIFILPGFTVFSQKVFKSENIKNRINEIAVIFSKEAQFQFEEIPSFGSNIWDKTEGENELELIIENWMFDHSYWSFENNLNSPFLEMKEQTEIKMEVEEWMYDDTRRVYFDHNNFWHQLLKERIEELDLIVEDWMSDIDLWKKPVINKIDFYKIKGMDEQKQSIKPWLFIINIEPKIK